MPVRTQQGDAGPQGHKPGATSRYHAENWKSTAHLDKELDARLAETLIDSTKREMELGAAIDRLQAAERSGEILEDVGPDSADGPAAGNGQAADLAGDTAEPATTLARVRFSDGEYFSFQAVAGDGEIGLGYHGERIERWTAMRAQSASILRAFCSVAPAGTPVPWLLAAVDRAPDRLRLIEGRGLCDALDAPVPVANDLVQLRIPGATGGWSPTDQLGVGFFCGINGKEQWEQSVIASNAANSETKVIKWNSSLIWGDTYQSTGNFAWVRVKTATTAAAACGSPVEIVHQYRKLGWFNWHWHTASVHTYGPGNLVGNWWLGIVKRRRQVKMTRAGGIGGFRSWVMFGPHLGEFVID